MYTYIHLDFTKSLIITLKEIIESKNILYTTQQTICVFIIGLPPKWPADSYETLCENRRTFHFPSHYRVNCKRRAGGYPLQASVFAFAIDLKRQHVHHEKKKSRNQIVQDK
jgi:hypothetical protein